MYKQRTLVQHAYEFPIYFGLFVFVKKWCFLSFCLLVFLVIASNGQASVATVDSLNAVDDVVEAAGEHGVEKSLRLDVIKAADDAIQPGGSLVLPSTDRQLVVDALQLHDDGDDDRDHHDHDHDRHDAAHCEAHGLECSIASKQPSVRRVPSGFGRVPVLVQNIIAAVNSGVVALGFHYAGLLGGEDGKGGGMSIGSLYRG